MFKCQYQNGKNEKIGKNFLDYKSGQERLETGAAFGISNRGKEISNWDGDYKLGREGFQIGTGITNRYRTPSKNEGKPCLYRI